MHSAVVAVVVAAVVSAVEVDDVAVVRLLLCPKTVGHNNCKQLL